MLEAIAPRASATKSAAHSAVTGPCSHTCLLCMSASRVD
jgi:hypothetical protein